jgi:acyl-CoA thioesterase
MSLPNLIASAKPQTGGFDISIPDRWLQGRTAYGGLSAALALEAARHADDNLPPLRSAQISYVGPLFGDVSVRASVLRRGKNAAFISSDVINEKGVGLRACFVFMASLESAVDYDVTTKPDIPQPEECSGGHRPEGNFFTNNFNWRNAWPKPELPAADVSRWVQLEDRTGLDPMVELIAIGDALPPAALPLMTVRGPISSMTWIVNILTPTPRTRDGWWLLRSTSDYTREGCCSQDMRIWNSDGELVATGMQSIALFA